MEQIIHFENLLEIAGIAGFGLYVCNYMMLTFSILTGNCIVYYVVNFSAASLVLTGLMNSFDLASALIQVFWICISTLGIVIRVRTGQPMRAPGPSRTAIR